MVICLVILRGEVVVKDKFWCDSVFFFYICVVVGVKVVEFIVVMFMYVIVDLICCGVDDFLVSE